MSVSEAVCIVQGLEDVRGVLEKTVTGHADNECVIVSVSYLRHVCDVVSKAQDAVERMNW